MNINFFSFRKDKSTLKTCLLLISITLIINTAQSESLSNKSSQTFDIKGIKMNMSLLEVTNVIGANGKVCLTENLSMSGNYYEKRFYPYGDVMYVCDSFSILGRETKGVKAFFINDKLSLLSISLYDHYKIENDFPDFFIAITSKFNTTPNYDFKERIYHKNYLTNPWEKETAHHIMSIISDNEDSSIKLQGIQMSRNENDAFDIYKYENLILQFYSKDFFKKAEQRRKDLQDLENRIQVEIDNKRKKDF